MRRSLKRLVRLVRPTAVVCMGLLLTSCDSSRTELIPIEVLFGNPSKYKPQLSPQGKYLSYLAPVDGVQNIWVRTIGTRDDHPVTNDTDRGIYYYGWLYSGEKVVYIQDKHGNEEWNLFIADLETNRVRQLTPPEDRPDHPVQTQFYKASKENPKEILIGMNLRDASIHDVYHLDAETGETTFLLEGNPGISKWIVDHDLTIRGYTKSEPGGGYALFLRQGGSGPFRRHIDWNFEDALLSAPSVFASDNRTMYLLDSRGRNTAALVGYDTRTRTTDVLAADDSFDVSDFTFKFETWEAQAAMIYEDRLTYDVFDSTIAEDIKYLQNARPGDMMILDRTLPDDLWLVAYTIDTGPVAYYAYDRGARSIQKLFTHRPELEGLPLQPMKPIEFTARDGWRIPGYLTLPKTFKQPGPMVLLVHGGPWSRDKWGFNSDVQWLVNRGYACLQVNFRGSRGFGKAFANAGNREWGRAMQNDLTDAVQWAIDEGIADPERIGIFGGSYGGYAAFAGVAFTPDLYTCAISVVGTTNLESYMQTIPPYWWHYREQMERRIGRLPRDENGEVLHESNWNEEDREAIRFLRERSPLYHADKVKTPLLIAHGALDPRIHTHETRAFVHDVRRNDVPVELVIYEDEAHGLVHQENRLDFYQRADAFLAKHLGGRQEK
ncbi:prolyl oligopeptidase family serine peptidase [bacterium]|nr:prolyl oligopeptidase family serine peptidase [bacterium]